MTESGFTPLSHFELDSFYRMLFVTAVRGAPDMKKEYLPGYMLPGKVSPIFRGLCLHHEATVPGLFKLPPFNKITKWCSTDYLAD